MSTATTVNAASIKALHKEGVLTDRQAEVAKLLVSGQKAREIAEKLGISRNAVYAQINAIKKKGVLDGSYTPSGEVRTPARAQATSPRGTRELVDFVTTPNDTPSNGDATPAPESHMAVIRELIAQNRKLLELLDRLSK